MASRSSRPLPNVALLLATVLGGCTNPTTEAVSDLPAAERNDLFIAAIRDAGFLCDTVLDAMLTESGRPTWRVVCNDALAYLAYIDAGNEIHIEPLPYTDPVRVLPPTDNIPTDRPRPQP